MSNTQVVKFDTLRSLAFGGISGTYAVLGAKFSYPVRIVVITNATNGDLFLSLDGTNDQFFMLANSFKLFDLNSNRILTDPQFVLPIGTQFFVKQSTAPSSGAIYLECLYGVQS